MKNLLVDLSLKKIFDYFKCGYDYDFNNENDSNLKVRIGSLVDDESLVDDKILIFELEIQKINAKFFIKIKELQNNSILYRNTFSNNEDIETFIEFFRNDKMLKVLKLQKILMNKILLA